MSSVQNMRLITDVQPLIRRDYKMARASLLNPTNSPGTASSPLYLLDGELLHVNEQYMLDREGPVSGGTYHGGGDPTKNPGDSGAAGLCPSFPFWLERGRYDMQAINQGTVLWGSFEADFHSDIVENATYYPGDRLYANWLTTGSDRNRRRGLSKTKNAGDAAHLMGYVQKVFPTGSRYAIRALLLHT